MHDAHKGGRDVSVTSGSGEATKHESNARTDPCRPRESVAWYRIVASSGVKAQKRSSALGRVGGANCKSRQSKSIEPFSKSRQLTCMQAT